MTAPLLDVRDLVTELEVGGGHVRILDHVSFGIAGGEILGLVGESGSGKSMTARSILRLLPPGARVRGEVRFDGADVLGLRRRSLRELRARRMAMIFQDPRAHIDPLYTSGDHLTEGLRVHGGLDRSAARARALELLSDVGIVDGERVLRSYPSELSGGMLQRVMIAGALAADPDLLIADEPTTALDVTIQAEIVAIFDDLRKQRDLAVLFITHDLELASALCDRVVVLYAGRVMEQQRTASLFAEPLHPYTAGLLAARPVLQARQERLTVIPGRPPTPASAPLGCPFHPRCAYAEVACTEAMPPLRAFGADRLTACRRTEEIAPELRRQTEVVRA